MIHSVLPLMSGHRSHTENCSISPKPGTSLSLSRQPYTLFADYRQVSVCQVDAHVMCCILCSPAM